MHSELLIYGTYIFFLLAGVAFGLLVGWLIGFQTARIEIPMLDPDYYAHEESLCPASADRRPLTPDHAPEVLS